MNTAEFLEKTYDECMSVIGKENAIKVKLPKKEKELLDEILKHSESARGVLTVVITSIVYKILNPDQDIRNHQESIQSGYSGRTFDTKYITPFLNHYKFPYMVSGSGWFTRSLEQKQPYNENYPGAIKPDNLKAVFLELIDKIQFGENVNEYLPYIMQGLILLRNSQAIDLAKPKNLSISTILDVLYDHFNSKYKAEGASRLPVLAIYAIYQCFILEAKRFSSMTLVPIESHTSADTRSGRIGDIEIIDVKNRPFEAVEVKYDIPISLKLVQDAYAKFQTTPVNRYYILSTLPQRDKEELDLIQNEIQKIKNVHGCQIIVNGIMPSLKYYLRLLEDTFEFIDHYVDLLEKDTALKFEHKQRWHDLIGELSK
jgi:DNA (cytosine-5)-methyltransferase 1